MEQETQDFLQRKVELAYLAAFYSGLLTDKQKEVLSMYCEEDITRSAEKLFHLEASLGTAERFRVMLSGLQSCRSLLRENRVDQAITQLDALIELYTEEDGHGI